MHSAAQHERGCSAGLRPAPAEAEATAKADYPWDGGVGPVAGDAVNPSLGAWPRHPCRGHPRNRTHPAFDRFPRSVDPRHAWMNLCQITKSIGARSVFQRKTDLAPGPHVVPGSVQPSPGNCQRWGGVGWQDRWRHGWRHRAPGVRALCLRSTASQAPERTAASGWAGPRKGVYGVSCQPTPPRQTSRKPEPLWLWLWVVAGQRPAHRGCRAQPCRPTLPCARKRFHCFQQTVIPSPRQYHIAEQHAPTGDPC